MSKPIHAKLLAASTEWPHLNSLITENGILRLKKRNPNELFDYLCKVVVNQQLSNKAADTIWARVVALADARKRDVYDILTPRYEASIRACGVSRAKLKAMMGLRQTMQKKLLSEEIHTTRDARLIIAEISKLWGFGSWSAEMAALFFFAQPDVWSEKDASLARGLTLVCDKDNCSTDEVLARMTPYRSYLALHIWYGLDTGRLQ